jgi:hypothetical protein
MKDAKLPQPSHWSMSQTTGMSVEPNQPRTHQGSCNACTERKEEHVTVVHLRGLSFRLCCACRIKLKELL